MEKENKMIYKNKKTNFMQLRISRDIHGRLLKYCDENAHSLRKLVDNIISDYLDKQGVINEK